MIDNLYIQELNVGIDIEYIKSNILPSYKNNAKFLKLVDDNPLGYHTLSVFDDSYITKLYNTFPWMGVTYNIYSLKNNESFMPHIDGQRKCAFNIPLLGTDKSFTIFYEPVNDLTTYNGTDSRGYILTSEIIESFRFTIDKPVLLDVTKIHAVERHSDIERLVLSWASTLNFEDTKKEFKKVLDNK